MAKVTIKDIARLAGVSQATVSYVVNNRHSGFTISQETSLRVLTVCARMNYHPDEVARKLYECRNIPLKLLVASPWLYSSFSDFSSQMNAVLREQGEAGRVVTTYASYSTGKLKECLKPMMLRRYDAVLVVGTDRKDDEWLEKHAAQLTKVVLMNRRVKGFVCCSGNDRTAVRDVTKCVDLAHYGQLVAILSSRQSFCEAQRVGGFIAECRAAGRNAEVLQNCRYEELWKDVQDRLTPEGAPLLLFVPQYIPAARLMKHAIEVGIRVPEQLGIICYDRNSLLDEFVSPRLTTVDPCIGEMTRQSIELLYAIRDQQSPCSALVEAVVLPGETTVNRPLDG